MPHDAFLPNSLPRRSSCWDIVVVFFLRVLRSLVAVSDAEQFLDEQVNFWSMASNR
jgi:hypothetical protein